MNRTRKIVRHSVRIPVTLPATMIYVLLMRSGNPLFAELDDETLFRLQAQYLGILNEVPGTDCGFVFPDGGIVDLRAVKGVMPHVPPEYANDTAFDAYLPEMDARSRMRLSVALATVATDAMRRDPGCDVMVVAQGIHEVLTAAIDDPDEYEGEEPDPDSYS